MHEILLHGAVPTNRHGQVLSILAGIAAMQPQPFHERRLIYKPTRPVTRPSMQVGGSQAVQSKQMNPMQTVQGAIQGDLFYLHLVEDLVVDGRGKGDMERNRDEEKTRESEMMDSGDGGDDHQPPLSTSHPNAKPPNWTLQFRDIPEAGNRRPVTVRLIADVPITAGNAEAFMSALEYTQTSTHHLHGHRLTHNSTSILLFQPPSQPLYILQLAVRVADGTKPALMDRGVKELMALKEQLKGVVDVDVVDRAVLDTRVR
ncbi:MAG: hypothetical protein LQ349_002631 [Xanthoria aureola]|nr:MAG: hypothetical protein LQ349_002631 [Xanthoria aureola]